MVCGIQNARKKRPRQTAIGHGLSRREEGQRVDGAQEQGDHDHKQAQCS